MTELSVGQLYSNEELFRSLKVSNAGGIRVCCPKGRMERAAIMTSLPGLHGTGENPYYDRLEADILTYTAAGKVGEQTLSGVNQRLLEQRASRYPIHGFILTASRRDKVVGPKRWRYLGLLEYLRHYPDTQLDKDGKVRRVWLFEFSIRDEVQLVPISFDAAIWQAMTPTLSSAREADEESVHEFASDLNVSPEEVERVRSQLLAMEPRRFEVFLKEFLVHSGFKDVCVTRFSGDGGVDVNARVSGNAWILENSLVQVQAKRWLHSVGRKEVAELRGSLQPFAHGAVVTTSHFTKAAIYEAGENGKNPVVLVDGFKLSSAIIKQRFGGIKV